MKTTLILLSCAMPFYMMSCSQSQPTEIHNITVEQPKPKPKPPTDRAEDFRATTTPR